MSVIYLRGARESAPHRRMPPPLPNPHRLAVHVFNADPQSALHGSSDTGFSWRKLLLVAFVPLMGVLVCVSYWLEWLLRK